MPVLNIETYDFGYRDPVGGKLPGKLARQPWSPAAVSAHTHAAMVTTFLRKVLKRNNIDNMGGRVVSTVNCVVKQFEQPPPGSKVWLNAFWDGTQMLYGQELVRRQTALDGLIALRGRPRAVSRRHRRHGPADLSRRNRRARTNPIRIFSAPSSPTARGPISRNGTGRSARHCGVAIRDMQNPTLHGQPKLMKDFINAPLTQNARFGRRAPQQRHSQLCRLSMSWRRMTAANSSSGRTNWRRCSMSRSPSSSRANRPSPTAGAPWCWRRGRCSATCRRKQIDLRVAAVEAGFDAAGIR